MRPLLSSADNGCDLCQLMRLQLTDAGFDHQVVDSDDPTRNQLFLTSFNSTKEGATVVRLGLCDSSMNYDPDRYDAYLRFSVPDGMDLYLQCPWPRIREDI